jgi:hypothetical protein
MWPARGQGNQKQEPGAGMWEHYRRTFVRIQIIILVICSVLAIGFKMPFLGIFVFFGVMEIFAIIGAWWGVRMRRKFERQDTLPLRSR